MATDDAPAADAAPTDATPLLSGPPEPLVTADQEIEVVRVPEGVDGVAEPDDLERIELNTWVCQRCGVETPTDPVDDVLEEPVECLGCDRQGPFRHAGLTSAELQTATRALGLWNPPSGVIEHGYAELWDDVREYIREYWATDEDAMYEGLTAFALSTWIRENLEFVPHLMLMGKTTGGKTRLLNSLKRVSYRAHVSVSTTPAAMYRLIDAHGVTFYVSEYHGLARESREQVDAVVRGGQKRGEVITRAEPTSTGYEPMAFDPFAHLAIASQYEPDDDIVNRCIQTRSSAPGQAMPATFDEARGELLRNRLLYARFRLLDSAEWDAAEARAYEVLGERGIDGRTREKLLSLVTAAVVWGRLDEFEPFIEIVVEQDQEAAADSEDARFVRAVRDLALEAVAETTTIGDADPFGAVAIPYSVEDGDGIVQRYEAMTGVEKSATWVGHLAKRLGIARERKRDGTVLADPNLGPKLRELCEDLGLEWASSDVHNPVRELPDEEKGPAASGCPECGADRTLTHRDVVERRRVCATCAEEIRDAH